MHEAPTSWGCALIRPKLTGFRRKRSVEEYELRNVFFSIGLLVKRLWVRMCRLFFIFLLFTFLMFLLFFLKINK